MAISKRKVALHVHPAVLTGAVGIFTGAHITGISYQMQILVCEVLGKTGSAFYSFCLMPSRYPFSGHAEVWN